MYINANDLNEKTGFSIRECRNLINIARKIMLERNYYIPKTRPKLAQWEIVKEILNDKSKIEEIG